MAIQWKKRYSRRTAHMYGSTIREILKLTQNSKVISFAAGLPSPEAFPLSHIAAATQRALKYHAAEMLQYGVTEGYIPLREMLVRHMRRYGIVCGVENILITTGSQQALDLIGKLLIDPGDRVIVEEPTYLGALQAWNAYGATYVPVPIDDQGMHTDVLEYALREAQPKFIYALPNFQNPSGVTLSNKRRVELIKLAEKYQVPIIEDDPYGQLRYEGDHQSTLFALEGLYQYLDNSNESTVSGNVLYLSTFSKTLCPGLRVGWIVGPEEVISQMAQAKQATDLHTSTFNQIIAYETARSGFLDDHIETIRGLYIRRRDAMLKALKQYFPQDVSWTYPAGGLFLWVTLSKDMNSKTLLNKAIEAGVAYVPGEDFYPCGGGENTMRLNFSYPTLEQIDDGIKRLATVLKTERDWIPAW